MHKDDNRQEYLKQALKLKQQKKQCWIYALDDIQDFYKITDRIENNHYKDEVEKKVDEKALQYELQCIEWDYKQRLIKRKQHENRQFSPGYFRVPLKQNLRKQGKLVQTLAKYVQNKNEYYIQVLN